MIEFRSGNILDSGADILVCPVNCVGTMGAGLAKQFKQRFPWIDDEYQAALRNGSLTIINPLIIMKHVYDVDQSVILFPTKWHWKEPSELWWIKTNLRALRSSWYDFENKSIAFPKLGCGLGGLDWLDVLEYLETFEAYARYEKVKVIVYA